MLEKVCLKTCGVRPFANFFRALRITSCNTIIVFISSIYTYEKNYSFYAWVFWAVCSLGMVSFGFVSLITSDTSTQKTAVITQTTTSTASEATSSTSTTATGKTTQPKQERLKILDGGVKALR